MPLSDDVRRELAAIEPRRGCDRLAELSGLFHTAGSLHLRGHGEFSVHLDVAESAVARRAFGLLRALRRRGRDPHVPAAGASSGRPATRSTFRAGSARSRCSSRPGSSRPRTRRSRRRRSGSSGARAAAARTCAARFSAAARSAGPRAPHLEIRSASRAGAERRRLGGGRRKTCPLRVHDRGRHALAYAKAPRRSPTRSPWSGAGDAALALDEHGVVAEARARANRVANADHANLVRSSRAAHAQVAGDRRLRGARAARRGCRPSCARSPSSGSAIRRSARGARREVPPAGDEGDDAQASGAAGRPRRSGVGQHTVALRGPMLHTFGRRVCARPPVDSDPVCRLGPERGATGGGGRPRSFPSGPLAAVTFPNVHCGRLRRARRWRAR